MVKTVLVDVADVVPLTRLELALESLHMGLPGERGIEEDRVGYVPGIRAVGEEKRGEKEQKAGKGNSDQAVRYDSRLTSSCRDA